MKNPKNVEVMLPEGMIRSLQDLSNKRLIDPDVLFRLAIHDFLVKFNNYKGDSEEREHYQFLYDHFAATPQSHVKKRQPERILI